MDMQKSEAEAHRPRGRRGAHIPPVHAISVQDDQILEGDRSHRPQSKRSQEHCPRSQDTGHAMRRYAISAANRRQTREKPHVFVAFIAACNLGDVRYTGAERRQRPRGTDPSVAAFRDDAHSYRECASSLLSATASRRTADNGCQRPYASRLLEIIIVAHDAHQARIPVQDTVVHPNNVRRYP